MSDFLEPGSHGRPELSSVISLKRIADALEALAQPRRLEGDLHVTGVVSAANFEFLGPDAQRSNDAA